MSPNFNNKIQELVVVAALSAYVSRLQQQNHRGLANMSYIVSRLQQKRNPGTKQL
jgi:hypothetical protein